VAVVSTCDGVLHQPVGEVIVVSGGSAGGRVIDRSQPEECLLITGAARGSVPPF
jgi:hypothetical protein